MRRLLAALRRDLLLQWRYGLYAISLLAIAFFALLVQLVPGSLQAVAATWAPAFLVGNLLLTTFFFMAGSVLLEREEGAVYATVATPLRDLEYLGSKALTLAALATVESVIIARFFFGSPARWWPLVLGLLSCSVLYAMIGFVSVARHRSINQWLMPSMLWVSFLLLPLIGHFGDNPLPWALWHPVGPPLLLMREAYEPAHDTMLLPASAGSLLWTIAAVRAARGAFQRWVTGTAGMAP